MLSLKIAARFLKFSKGQTILIMFGIAIGISVQIFVGLLLQSLQISFLEQTVGDSAHVEILPEQENETIANWELIMEKAENVKDVKYVSAAVDSPAQALLKDKTKNVLVRGFIFEKADKIYELNDAVYKGNLPKSNSEVLIGKEFSEETKIQVGDTLTIANIKGFQTKIQNYTVSGLYDLGVADLNNLWIIMPLSASQEFFDLENTITSVEIQIDDVFTAKEVAKAVKKEVSTDKVKVENWMDNNGQFLNALQSQGASSYMIQVFVLFSVLLGIASVLAITVVQKSRQIGILKAMGIKDRDASKIFLLMGFILGTGGAILGAIFGVMLVLLFYTFAGQLFEIQLNLPFIISSVIVVIIASVLSALLPARKSAKLNPIEVIRNG